MEEVEAEADFGHDFPLCLLSLVVVVAALDVDSCHHSPAWRGALDGHRVQGACGQNPRARAWGILPVAVDPSLQTSW